MDEISIASLEGNPILTPPQKVLLGRFLASELAENYYLSGGTALAGFHLLHRESQDLDFFTPQPVELGPIEAFLRTLPGVAETFFERRYDRFMFTLRLVDGGLLKVQFDYYPHPQIEPPGRVIGSLKVDGLRDLLVNKLHALSERVDSKDFVDVYCLLEHVSREAGEDILERKPHPWLERAIQDFERKFGLQGATYIIQTGFARIRSIREMVPTRKAVRLEDIRTFVEIQLREWARRNQVLE